MIQSGSGRIFPGIFTTEIPKEKLLVLSGHTAYGMLPGQMTTR